MLPQNPGSYFWYILDLGYFEIGSVDVLKDTEQHLDYLRQLPMDQRKQFYLYQNDNGEWLTMYHDAYGGSAPHLPPCDEHSGRPCVNGYVQYDLFKFINADIEHVKRTGIPSTEWTGAAKSRV